MAGHDREECPGEDGEIEPERHTPDVFRVQPYPIRLAEQLAATDLPEAGYTRADGEEETAHVAPLGQLVERDHPRSNQAHLAAQDVHQLRELVEAEAAKPASHRGDTRIGPDLV